MHTHSCLSHTHVPVTCVHANHACTHIPLLHAPIIHTNSLIIHTNSLITRTHFPVTHTPPLPSRHSHRQLPVGRVAVAGEPQRPQQWPECDHHSWSVGGLLAVCLSGGAGLPQRGGLCPLLHLHHTAVLTSQLLWHILPHDPAGTY